MIVVSLQDFETGYALPLYMTAKYKRSTRALSVVRLMDENDITDGVKRSGQLNIDRKIFLSSFERC